MEEKLLIGVEEAAAAIGLSASKFRVMLAQKLTPVSDALFAAVGSTDPLPALAGDQVQNLLWLPDAPRSYGDLAKALLLGMPRVLQACAEHDEMQAQAKAEADAENRKLTAQARAEAAGLPPPHLGRPRKTSEARKNSVAVTSVCLLLLVMVLAGWCWLTLVDDAHSLSVSR